MLHMFLFPCFRHFILRTPRKANQLLGPGYDPNEIPCHNCHSLMKTAAMALTSRKSERIETPLHPPV